MGRQRTSADPAGGLSGSPTAGRSPLGAAAPGRVLAGGRAGTPSAAALGPAAVRRRRPVRGGRPAPAASRITTQAPGRRSTGRPAGARPGAAGAVDAAWACRMGPGTGSCGGTGSAAGRARRPAPPFRWYPRRPAEQRPARGPARRPAAGPPHRRIGPATGKDSRRRGGRRAGRQRTVRAAVRSVTSAGRHCSTVSDRFRRPCFRHRPLRVHFCHSDVKAPSQPPRRPTTVERRPVHSCSDTPREERQDGPAALTRCPSPGELKQVRYQGGRVS